MTECVFCDIVAGSAPARVVYSDDHILAFLDVRPITRGHTLVVPRVHATGLTDLPDPTGARMLSVSRHVAAAMKASRLSVDGINLTLNDGRSACQSVFHTHLHVIPRTSGDRLRFMRGLVMRRDRDPDGTAQILRDALDATATR